MAGSIVAVEQDVGAPGVADDGFRSHDGVRQSSAPGAGRAIKHQPYGHRIIVVQQWSAGLAPERKPIAPEEPNETACPVSKLAV
ncbi:MAG: hypothetical protein HOP95_01930 [Sphingomonas sp.]|nr:hypothetical protein [Sphingomonas sp.]